MDLCLLVEPRSHDYTLAARVAFLVSSVEGGLCLRGREFSPNTAKEFSCWKSKRDDQYSLQATICKEYWGIKKVLRCTWLSGNWGPLLPRAQEKRQTTIKAFVKIRMPPWMNFTKHPSFE